MRIASCGLTSGTGRSSAVRDRPISVDDQRIIIRPYLVDPVPVAFAALLEPELEGFLPPPGFYLIILTSSVAAAVDEAGFWPVISLPSTMAKLSQSGAFS
jgi:hypothetical protein